MGPGSASVLVLLLLGSVALGGLLLGSPYWPLEQFSHPRYNPLLDSHTSECSCDGELARLREWRNSRGPAAGANTGAGAAAAAAATARAENAGAAGAEGAAAAVASAAAANAGVAGAAAAVAGTGGAAATAATANAGAAAGAAAEAAAGATATAAQALGTGPGRSLLQASSDGQDGLSPQATLQAKQKLLKALQQEFADLKLKFSKVNYDKFLLDLKLSDSGADWEKAFLTPKAMGEARSVLAKCGEKSGIIVVTNTTLWKGYSCGATSEELQSFFDYEVFKQCPDDWLLVQHLVYVRNCFALPKRRCLARTTQDAVEPMPLPRSLFDQRALNDANVRWSLHWCKSFECLNTRMVGDCRNCFNMSLEVHRWNSKYRGSLPMKEVIEMKKGSLRLGLDAGGGTGSFAAHMARHGVTVMTTAMNIETVMGRAKGLPYMETIALRGLVPLFVPHKSRLPFFDNTLDIIHCVNSIKYLPMLEFEELLFEWDRVLRVGGVLWFEMFYAPVDEMPMYVAIIEMLNYKRLYWNMTPKPDEGERVGMHVYLNCVIEKPVRKDA